MTKQTKPVQIGLVCFAFKLLRSVQETRHRRNSSTYFFSEGSMAFPDRSDLPARMMLTSEGSVSRNTHVVADPRTQRLRTLTPIECERLNGFPDDWTAGMPERLRYFTMGNALVVPLVKAMGKPDQRTGRGRVAQLMGVSLGFPKGVRVASGDLKMQRILKHLTEPTGERPHPFGTRLCLQSLVCYTLVPADAEKGLREAPASTCSVAEGCADGRGS